ncbi:MAG: hypothetical protein K0Q49_206 [Haloplasmataceae bacterium]|nr:hypothetical protein [Haloplasmataceae bacterium]
MRELLDEDSKTSHVQLIDKLAKTSNLFRNYKNDLKEFAELRNAIVHNTHFCGNPYGDVIAEPHDIVVEMYQDLLNQVTKPQTAKDIYRKTNDESVYSASSDTKIIDIIKNMYNKAYTCVPVIENKKIVGVFSENVLISLFAIKGNIDISNLKINDINELVDMNNHYGEYFKFCKVKDTIFDIKELFQTKREDHKRLEMIFVTGNGLSNEDVLGVISAWDLI